MPKPTDRPPQGQEAPRPTPRRFSPNRAGSPASHQPAAAPKAISISPARSAAFAILERIATSAAHSDDLLFGPAVAELSEPDRNLTTTLVLGVLRWQIALDAILLPLLQRPEIALATPVAIALRLAAFQLLHLDRIPAHAALSESVELARASGHAHAAGMVNAVLRQLTRQERTRPKLYESTATLAERLSHPRWLVERWIAAYGRAAAVATLEYDQRAPESAVLFATEADHAEDVSPDPAPSGIAPPSTAASDAATVALPNIDAGSRLVAELAAASQPGAQRIWDCCAAPGGKTLLLARRHPNASLLASDVSPRRLERMAQRLQAAAPGVRTLQADVERLPEAEGNFDLILCDAPCTGTGTLARNPEIKERLRPEDLGRQSVRQRALLTAALQRLLPGGRLVYSTCSLEREENEAVVAGVLAKLPPGVEVRSIPVLPVLQSLQSRGVVLPGVALEPAVRDGYLRTIPGGPVAGDGFFAAVLERL